MRFKKTGIGYLWLGLIFTLFMIAVGILSGLVMFPFEWGLAWLGMPPVGLLAIGLFIGLLVLGYALHWFVSRNQFDKGKTRWY